MDETCIECGATLPFKPCRSAAGWYVGTWCNRCGPHDRKSFGYYATKEEAQAELDAWVRMSA
jgi:hypothetical protein